MKNNILQGKRKKKKEKRKKVIGNSHIQQLNVIVKFVIKGNKIQ